jgi:hypothetical protein
MIHTIEIDDNTELGKKSLTLLEDLGLLFMMKKN